MGLNIVQSGEFKPYCKYNAKAGRWYVKKDDEETEVPNPTFVADFDTIKTGWFLFLEGQAPNIKHDPSLTEAAPKPSDSHKRGFEINLFSQSLFGGVVVMTASSMHINNAINEVYEQYEAQRAANPGKLPVISCTGTTPMKDKMGTNYKPNLTLVKWVDKPAELGGSGAASAPTPVATPVAPANVSEF